VFFVWKFPKESPADAGIPARRKNDEKIPPFRSYNKFQSSRKSGVYSLVIKFLIQITSTYNNS